MIKTTYETVALLRSGAATGAKEMAALARLGSETAPLVALGTAVDFGELLAVFGALAPTAGRAGLVALGAFAFRLGEVVDVDVLGTGTGDDLLPVDGLHVAQVVVVEQTATARQNICNNSNNNCYIGRFVLFSGSSQQLSIFFKPFLVIFLNEMQAI